MPQDNSIPTFPDLTPMTEEEIKKFNRGQGRRGWALFLAVPVFIAFFVYGAIQTLNSFTDSASFAGLLLGLFSFWIVMLTDAEKRQLEFDLKQRYAIPAMKQLEKERDELKSQLDAIEGKLDQLLRDDRS